MKTILQLWAADNGSDENDCYITQGKIFCTANETFSDTRHPSPESSKDKNKENKKDNLQKLATAKIFFAHFSLCQFTDSCQSGKAVVERVEELPALIIWEDGGARHGDDQGEQHHNHDQVNLHKASFSLLRGFRI